MQPDLPSDVPQSTAELGPFRVAYSVEGTQGPAVLMIPGLPGSARDFRWLAPVLAPWARVVRFDPPGYGASPRPRFVGLSAVQKARTAAELIDLLELDPVVLLGHSFGSVVAAETARLRPGTVSHLVLLAPPGVKAHFPVRAVRASGRVLQSERGRRLLRGPQRSAYRSAGFPSFLTDEELACTTLDSGQADFGSYRAALVASRLPTLIAYALDDRQVPSRNSAALHRCAGPGPRVAFATGGHNIQKSRAVELAGFIHAFLGR